MGIDISARASAVGVTTQFKDLRGGSVLFLPQRLAVFAQGRSDKTYSTTKRQVTSALEVGAVEGFGSPAHLILEQLLPANGDGVGTIPVDLYPLVDDAAGQPAVGVVTPSGTATVTDAYRPRIGGVLGNQFVVPVGAVVVNNVLRGLGKAIRSVLSMPVDVTYTHGTITAAPGGGNTGDGTVTSLSSPDDDAHPGVYTLTVNAAVAHGGVFTFVDPDGLVLSKTVTMTPGTGGATVINIAGLEFTITDGAADFVVGDTFTITVPATDAQLTSTWEGASANDILIEILGPSVGVNFVITQPAGGLVNPSVQAALDQVGNVWESLGLNALNIEDTTNLDRFKTFGEGRWGTLVRKPLVVFTGNTQADWQDATEVSAARKDDRVNSQLVAPGSPNLPFVVAARQLARIAKVAQNNPPTNYGAQRATGLTPGTDAQEWDYLKRDAAFKAGSSTVEFRDGVVTMLDTITFFAPEGDPTPAYQYVVDIVKLQQVIYNFDLAFSATDWAGAPLIPDASPTVNPLAKKPKMAIALANSILDSLGANAIIADAAAAKKNTTATINAQNPKRLDVSVTFALSGNTEIKDITLNFGFFFGEAAQAA